MNALYRTFHKLVKEELERQKPRQSGRWRPRFHVTPPAGWLNDPNGLCQQNGVYHAFYQYSPFEAKGGLKFWAHCVSEDMLHWSYEGAPLSPDQPYDCHGVYSGSALIEEGQMALYYTGNVKQLGDYDYINTGRESNTVLAVSRDGEHFEKRLLMTNADYPKDLTCHVRDPKVWKQDGRYYMVQGARTKEDKGVVLVFESEDGLSWSCIHRLESKEVFGFMWECPDLYEVDGHTVLSISPQGVEADGLRFNNVYQSVSVFLDGDFREAAVEGPYKELDGGFDFYAPQTFETEDGRRILIGWMGMADAEPFYSNRSLEEGWQHALTLPREVSVKNGVLCQNPIRELESCWNQFLPVENTYSGKPGDCLELSFSEIGREIRVTLAEGLLLRWEESEKIFWMEFTDKQLGVGRSKRGRRIDRLRDMRVIADGSCLEVFLNGGEDVFSTRFYPESADFLVEVQGAGCKGQLCLP